MLTKPFASFIIPAYNAENVIKQCLDSILLDIKRSNLFCEIIIIENGSTDSTYKVIENRYLLNENIVLIQSEKGASKARNAGIKIAKGNYMIFVDADDLWLPGSLEYIEDNCKEKNCDLLICSFIKNGRVIRHDYMSLDSIIEKDELSDCRAWMLKRPTLRMTVWAKVYRSDIIRNNSILFDESLSFSEDSEFIIRYTKFCKKIMIVNKPIYQYCNDLPSAMRSFNKLRINGYINSLNTSAKNIENEPDKIKEAFIEYTLIHFNIICVHDVFDIEIRNSFIKRIRIMKDLMQMEIFSKAIEHIQLKKCLSLQLLPEAFIKCHLPVVVGGICYVRSLLNHRHYRKITFDIDRCTCL